ncbi:MAG: AMP-binding protein [Gemmataceae bacterium]|nr:AMP-binding protein [Gemmataceae bacterium]
MDSPLLAGPSPRAVNDTVNVASHLAALAQERPHALAVVFPHGRDRQGHVSYTHYTFHQLHTVSDQLAHGLEAIGIRRGTRTVLMVRPSLEFFALTFALLKVAAAPVMVDPGMGVKRLGRCLAEAEPEAFIGIPKAHAARLILGWARRTIRICVTVGRRWCWGGHTLDQVQAIGERSGPFEMARTAADETAAIAFTSGSTGVPKGVVYTHGIFVAQVEMLRQLYNIEPGEVDLPTFPLFALFAPALGMTCIIPDMDATRPAQVDPRKIVEAIDNFGVTNMFGSPALLDRVGRYGVKHDVRLPSLKRVISAGAPVHASILDRLQTLLAPGVQVFTPYGATEAMPVCSIGSDEILSRTRSHTAEGGGVCVGRPVAPVEANIIRISDDPIPLWSNDLVLAAGEIGEIVVKGPIVTREYYRRPESNALAKIADPEQGAFYHRMGDLGYRDDEGRLWFCGRKSHRVQTREGTLFTIPCEAVFNTHPAVFRTALVGVSDAGASRPVLCVELEDKSGSADLEKIKRELLALGEARPHTRGIETILFHPSFPVDIRHNAKIFREKLAVWAARQLP